MRIDEVRIYSEVIEQGLDFKSYLLKSGIHAPIKTIYAKKGRQTQSSKNSVLSNLRSCKDVDVIITFVSDKKEYPVLLVEYSTAVPTDDHKMQRSDVYFWGSVFKVPELKIYPKTKGMNQKFGGGNRFSEEEERAVAYNHGSILWMVLWETIDKFDVLKTKEGSLSCIHYSSEILNSILFIKSCFKRASNYLDLYAIELLEYRKNIKNILSKYENDNHHRMIVNSSRFKWETNKGKLVTKINRFGHAMDPDRGALFFVNMLVGFEHAVTEIQVNRQNNIKARGGYGSLFDSISSEKEMLEYIQNIIDNKNNVFDENDAIYVFKKALNISGTEITFKKMANKEYAIDDKDLLDFLLNHPSITTKSIFYLTSELRLTDKNRRIICRIKWNKTPVDLFFDSLLTSNYSPLSIAKITQNDIKEDIVTYASVELYKRLKFGLIAVSYPGAQGDRAILTGSGRSVKRTYIDVIAYSIKNNEYILYLEECKDNLIKSKKDIKKLQNIVSDSEKMNGLKELCKKTIKSGKFAKVYISLGGAFTNAIKPKDVDYIFMFEIANNKKNSKIDYTIAIVNLSLVSTFKPLANKDNKLQGVIELSDVYKIQ